MIDFSAIISKAILYCKARIYRFYRTDPSQRYYIQGKYFL